MQERLTKQIAVAVTQAVQPSGVAVIIEGEIPSIHLRFCIRLPFFHYVFIVISSKTRIAIKTIPNMLNSHLDKEATSLIKISFFFHLSPPQVFTW